MAPEMNIATLRSRVSELVDQEAKLLSQAFELSRSGSDRAGVDALFARVQSIQRERSSFTRQIGQLLGSQRLHSASEVWRIGIYDYRREVGGESVRVRVTQGPLGLQAQLPGKPEPVRLERLDGTFDGPLSDDAGVHHPAPAPASKAPAGRARPRAKKRES